MPFLRYLLKMYIRYSFRNISDKDRSRTDEGAAGGGKRYIPIDDNGDSDSGSDSPKHWQKNPLCVKKTKKRSNGRPSSGEVHNS